MKLILTPTGDIRLEWHTLYDNKLESVQLSKNVATVDVKNINPRDEKIQVALNLFVDEIDMRYTSDPEDRYEIKKALRNELGKKA